MLGLGLLALFLLSDLAQTPTCNLLVAGGASLIFGVALWFRDPVKPGPPSDRFRILKRKPGKQGEKK